MRYRIEVYNAAGTARLAVFNPRDVADPVIDQEENGVHTLTFGTRCAGAAYGQLVKRCQVWITDRTFNLTQKFRVIDIGKERSLDTGRWCTVEADHLLMDLGRSVIGTPKLYSGLPADDLLDLILTGSTWTVGTIDAAMAAVVIPEFEVGGATRLSQLRHLAELVDGVLVGNDNLTVDLLARLDLTGTPSVTFRPERNMPEVDRGEDSREWSSRVYAVGGGEPRMTLAGAWFPMESLSSGSGLATIQAYYMGFGTDSYFDTAGWDFYIEQRSVRGSYYPVTSFLPQHGGAGQPDKIIVSTTALPAVIVGEFRLLVDRGDGAGIVPLDSLIDKDAYDEGGWSDAILDESDLEPVDNLFSDAFLSRRAYVTGKHPSVYECSNYLNAPLGAVFTENTDRDYIQNGSKSQIVATTYPGQGALIALDWSRAEADVETFSVRVLLKLIAGAVQVDLGEEYSGWSQGVRGTSIFPPANGEPVQISAVGEWATVEFAAMRPGDATAGAICIYQFGPDAAQFAIDSVMVVPAASPPQDWVDGSNKRELWKRAYLEARRRRTPVISYSAKIVDLYGGDPKKFPYDAIALSAVAALTDSQLGLTDVAWIKRVKQLLDKPIETEITVATYSESIQDPVADLQLDLARTQARAAKAVNARQRVGLLNVVRRAIVMNPDDTNSPVQQVREAYGQQRHAFLQVAYLGEANHGCIVLDRLVVPAGYKAVILAGVPIDTSVKTTAQHVFFNESVRQAYDPVTPHNLSNQVHFGLYDSGGDPIKWIKTGLVEMDDWDTLNPPNLDRSRLHHSFLPPGTYNNLAFVCFGSSMATASIVAFAANLLVGIVPLFRGRLGQYANVGQTSVGLSYHDTLPFSGVVPHRAKLQIGEGDDAEIVQIDVGNQGSFPYSSYARWLRSGTSVRIRHKQGAPVIEVASSGSYGPYMAEPDAPMIVRTVVTPTVTYA